MHGADIKRNSASEVKVVKEASLGKYIEKDGSDLKRRGLGIQVKEMVLGKFWETETALVVE